MTPPSSAPVHEQRRRFARIFFNAHATLRLNDQVCTAQLLDLSLRGALLALPADCGLPAVGTACHFELQLGDAAATISMLAAVAHTEPHGGAWRIGLHCQEMDLDSVTHLRRLVELNLGDDALLHRELIALAVPDEAAP